jgi:hypothetical protein
VAGSTGAAVTVQARCPALPPHGRQHAPHMSEYVATSRVRRRIPLLWREDRAQLLADCAEPADRCKARCRQAKMLDHISVSSLHILCEGCWQAGASGLYSEADSLAGERAPPCAIQCIGVRHAVHPVPAVTSGSNWGHMTYPCHSARVRNLCEDARHLRQPSGASLGCPRLLALPKVIQIVWHAQC